MKQPRGWEKFLTERDRRYLAATSWTKREPFGLGSRPALLVVDDYYAVVGTEREPILESVRVWPKSCGEEGWDAIDRTADLLVHARAADVPVVHVTRLPGVDAPWGRRGPPKNDMTPAQRSVAYEIVDEVAPHEGELVVRKAAPSAFAGTPLEYRLRYLGIDTVVVCGESTSGCVRATVVDAATRRFRVGVVEPCCFDRIQASHYMSLFDMHQKYADILDFEDAVDYLTFDQSGSTPNEGATCDH